MIGADGSADAGCADERDAEADAAEAVRRATIEAAEVVQRAANEREVLLTRRIVVHGP